MNRILGNFVLALLLLLGSSSAAWAQTEEYNPSNPPEPYARYKVTTKSAYGWTSGGGTYQQGNMATIRVSSSNANYTFAYWTKNGERYTDKQEFVYRVEENARFEAVFDFTPVNPLEPVMPNTYRLYLTTDLEGACSFNRTSGAKVEADEYVQIKAISSPGFVFEGWYLNGNWVSDQNSFNYLMPRSNVSLEARFSYSPDNPDEPNSSGGQTGNVANGGKKGDVNGDAEVNTNDAVIIINSFVNGTMGELSKAVADVNGDGEVNTSDAVIVINNYVNNK